MERNQGLWKGALLYGGILVVFLALGFTGLYLAGQHPVIMGRYLQFILPPAFAFLMLRVFKEQWNGGLLHFWEGMTMGFLYALTIGIGTGFVAYIFVAWVDPELMVQWKALLVEQTELQKQKMGDDFSDTAYTTTLEAIQSATPANIFQDWILKMGGVGLFATSFITIFMRKTEAR